MVDFLKAWAASLLVDGVHYGMLRLVDAPPESLFNLMVLTFLGGTFASLGYAAYCESLRRYW